jgi:hypothetical protein
VSGRVNASTCSRSIKVRASSGVSRPEQPAIVGLALLQVGHEGLKEGCQVADSAV